MYVEQWITSSDMVSLPVHHARLRINNTCVVLLASLDDPECPRYLIPPTRQPMHTTHTSTSVISDMMTSGSNTASKPTTAAQSTMGSSMGETMAPLNTKQQPQSDVGAIVGGASTVAIVLIITAGVVLMFLLYSSFKLKHMQAIEQRY